MKNIVYLLPTVLLVSTGQVLLKWRMNQLEIESSLGTQAIAYLRDPWILMAYAMGLLGSFVWLFAVARAPLTFAFPIYQGLVFMLVLIGGSLALNEAVEPMRLVSVGLILCGIVIGARSWM